MESSSYYYRVFKISGIAGRFAAISANLLGAVHGGYVTREPWILILLPMDIIYSLNVKFTTTLQVLGILGVNDLARSLYGTDLILTRHSTA